MLVSIFIVLVILAFVFLIIGVVSGLGNDSDKIGPPITFILLSAILFTVVAFFSFDLTEKPCINQINSTFTIGNATTSSNSTWTNSTTTYTNSITCTTNTWQEAGLGGLFGVMVIFCIVLLIICVSGRLLG